MWVGSWLYDLAQSEERLVTVSNSSGQITAEYGFTLAASSGDSFELWDLWPPSDVHQKMNMTLRNSWRMFPNIVIAETMVVQQGLVRYGLLDTDLTQSDMTNPSCAYVIQMHIERNSKVYRGQITSTAATTTRFTDNAFPYDSDKEVDSDWLIGFYNGPGGGQLRQINTVDSDLLFTMDTDMLGTDLLTTDTLYAAWNPTTDMQREWFPLTAVRFDQLEYPNYFELRQLYSWAYGQRIRITYVEQTTDFTAEADVTRVPEEYVVFKSLSMLYDELVADNRHDRQSHSGLAQYYDELAQDFVAKNRRILPASMLWSEVDYADGSAWSGMSNPLSW